MPKVSLKPLLSFNGDHSNDKEIDISCGKTIIGRGPLLRCMDKKVSRNHALLEVNEDGKVILTATHVNPCFFRADSDVQPKILKKDKSQVLSAGDTFSLLPNAFFYKVVLDGSSNHENKLNNKETSSEDKLENKNAKKEDEKETISAEKDQEKEVKVKEDNEKESLDEIKKENSAEENTTNGQVTESVDKKEAAAKPEQKVEEKEKSEGSTKPSPKKRTLPAWMTECTNESADDKPPPSKKKDNKANSTPSPRKRRGANQKRQTEIETTVSRSSRQNRQTRQHLSLDDFIASDDDSWSADSSDNGKKNSRRRSRANDSDSDWETEYKGKRKGRYSGGKSGSDSDWGKSSSSKKKKGRGRGRRKKASDSDDEPDVSPSPPPTRRKAGRKAKRTKCEFAGKCYRRNPDHKAECIHPGDTDWESDSSDNDQNSSDKPECPFGIDCYRKNPEHKKAYTHTKKVRPQRNVRKLRENNDERDGSEESEEEFSEREESFSSESDWNPEDGEPNRRKKAQKID